MLTRTGRDTATQFEFYSFNDLYAYERNGFAKFLLKWANYLLLCLNKKIYHGYDVGSTCRNVSSIHKDTNTPNRNYDRFG